ncbi:helicase-associated domain-containing protein [Rhodococcus sp. NPDC058521]|uniref:helicase-associated domain-containing protein n=1 Tax=Rhodococcus sp. NPDC058521 TaxID=3346536 RepID=UPI0036626741
MTEIDDSSETTTSAATFAEWLAHRSDAELTELLRRRPDLAVPPPSTVVVLAGRAEQRASVVRAADDLTTLDFGILEALLLEGAEETGVAREVLAEAVGGRATKKAVDKAIDGLRASALVWGDRSLRVMQAVRATIPWRVGSSADTTDVLSEPEIAAALTTLESRERDLLDTLARTSSIGRTRDAAPGTSPDRPVQRLLSAGLLHWIDAETVELPHRVRQVLRGEAVFDPTALTPPTVPTRKNPPADINAAAAGESLELIRHCENVVTILGESPAPMLRAGGLGVRELRRITKSAGIDEARVSLVVEMLAGAGLIAAGIPDPVPVGDTGDTYWAPSTGLDAWSNASTAKRWHTLASAWLDLPRVPWFVGMRDSNDKPVAALSDEARAPSAPLDRRTILGAFADLGTGRSATADHVSRLLAWQRPRWGARLRPFAVERTLAEATALGLVAHGALSSPGRALLHGGDAEAEMHTALPEPVDYFLVQADLTVVVPGPLTPDLLEQLTLVADIESAGAASMYRISEASVRRALDVGTSATELHSLFSSRSRTPVPQSLTYLIDDVARRHGRLRAGVATAFVRCEDPSLLAEVLASPVAEPLALRALAPTVAVSQAPLRDVLAELRSAGFSPAGEDSTGALVDLRPRGARVQTRRPRVITRTPAVAADAQLEALVRTLRAGDRAASADVRGGVRSDGSRAGTAATLALLAKAASRKSSVTIGYVDAQGVATHRIVDPVSVGGGQLDAYDPATGSVRRFTLHRITSVSPVG